MNQPNIIKKVQPILLIFAWVGMSFQAIAQYELRMLDPLAGLSRKEKKELKNQASSFYNASNSSVAQAAESTVTLYYQDSKICYGTVVTSVAFSQPVILTKWSEIKNICDHIVAITSDGQALATTLVGVYPDHDLAVISSDNRANQLKPIKFSSAAPLSLGSFILLAGPDGDVESIGIVSVQARSLRDGDKAYLGVMMDFDKGAQGVPLKKIMPGSAAAKAGLREGDIILAVDQDDLSGAMEMRTLLQRLQPGSNIVVTYQRGKQRKKTNVELGSLSENSTIRRLPQERMDAMESMGAVPSNIRTNFPSVMQSDMPIHPRDAGAPVTDLDGEFTGIAIARGSRIKTYIIPARTIQMLLSEKPQAPNMAFTKSNTGSKSPLQLSAEKPLDQVRRLLGKSRSPVSKNQENILKIQKALEKLRLRDKNKP